jgi:parvulin-like peptidyl-prolyl isomerase
LTQKLVRIVVAALWTSVTCVVTCGCRDDAASSSSTVTTNPPPLHPTTSPSADEIIAHVGGVAVTRRELDQPLIEAFGLKMLLVLIQLDLARQAASNKDLHVTPQDVQTERDITLTKMFPDASKADWDQLLEQFLRQQNLTKVEFDLVLETNANLRKIALPQLPGKITDEMVHSAFNQLYGENRQIEDIEVSNAAMAAKVIQLSKTEPFETIAREMSEDTQTAGNGGELPPFSSQSTNVADVIKNATFALELNQVSDTLEYRNKFHVIKLIRIIPPKLMKFEDVKDSVRQQLEDQWVQFAMKNLRDQLGQAAVQYMQIEEPTLSKQWIAKVNEQKERTRDRNDVLEEMNRHRLSAATQSTTQPTAVPGQPPVIERPPATMPGAAAPGGTH